MPSYAIDAVVPVGTRVRLVRPRGNYAPAGALGIVIKRDRFALDGIHYVVVRFDDGTVSPLWYTDRFEPVADADDNTAVDD